MKESKITLEFLEKLAEFNFGEIEIIHKEAMKLKQENITKKQQTIDDIKKYSKKIR